MPEPEPEPSSEDEMSFVEKRRTALCEEPLFTN